MERNNYDYYTELLTMFYDNYLKAPLILKVNNNFTDILYKYTQNTYTYLMFLFFFLLRGPGES